MYLWTVLGNSPESDQSATKKTKTDESANDDISSQSNDSHASFAIYLAHRKLPDLLKYFCKLLIEPFGCYIVESNVHFKRARREKQNRRKCQRRYICSIQRISMHFLDIYLGLSVHHTFSDIENDPKKLSIVSIGADTTKKTKL